MDEQETGVVTVEILGQRYPIRSKLGDEYVAKLASYVDEKMQTSQDRNATGDSVRVAVLAALNIADELFRHRQAQTVASGDVRKLTFELEEFVDQAIVNATTRTPET